jgi:hypothetical protein
MTRSMLLRRAQILIQRFKQPSVLVLAPPRELGFQFSPLDFEGRRSAERRALVVNKKRLSDAPSQRLLRPWDRCDSGDGRLPKAPRVHACEAWPRAPHRPSGCPSGQLSLCPTSVTPLEAPLTGQDTSRISEVLGTGIGIHSQVRERRLQTFVSRARCGFLHAAPQNRDRTEHRRLLRPRLCSAPLRKNYALHRARDTRPTVGSAKTLPDRDRRSSTDLRRS